MGSRTRVSGVSIFLARGYHNDYLSQTVQATETAVLGTNINETRFQYYRSAYQLTANTTDPTILVLNSFNDGASTVGHTSDQQNYFELQNYTTISKKAHQFKFGVRMRGQTDNNTSPTNFGGTFTFAGGLAPALDSNNLPITGPDVQITSIERYRRTLLFQGMGYMPSQIAALGGEPSQFSISAGNPNLALHQMDASVFVGDDWKMRPNFTLSLGLRYEMQTNISDHADFAPRIGFAYALGGANNPKPKTVIRGGFGMFYDRFALGNTLTADRFNGSVEQAYVVTNPLFYPNIPSIASLTGSLAPQVLYEKDSNLHAPYLMQSAVTLERQLPSNTTLSVTYTNSHGLHELRSFDINAPLPGTYPLNPIYPLGNSNPELLMTTSGLYNQNQLITNINSRVGQNVSLFGFYMLNKAMSNTDGLGTYPSNPYSQVGEYGPSSNDIRNRAFIGGSINTKWNMRFSPFINLNSGAPFDITSGSDLYGTSLFNSRPGIATNPQRAGVDPDQVWAAGSESGAGREDSAAQLRARAGAVHGEPARFKNVRLWPRESQGIGDDAREYGWRAGTRSRPHGRSLQFANDRPALQPDYLNVGAEFAESHQSGTDHRRYHVASVRAGELHGGWLRRVFGECE